MASKLLSSLINLILLVSISQTVGLLAVLPLFILGYVILQNLEVDESY